MLELSNGNNGKTVVKIIKINVDVWPSWTSKNISSSPALVSSPLRSELSGHDEALPRLFPWSLGRKHTTLSTNTKVFLFSVVRVVHILFLKRPQRIVYEKGFGALQPTLINLWLPTKIYLLKTSQIYLTIWNIVKRNNNNNNNKIQSLLCKSKNWLRICTTRGHCYNKKEVW